MSIIAVAILGAIAASVIWLFAIAWLLDVIGAQRQALASAQTTLRLYRDATTQQQRALASAQLTIRLTQAARDESDSQVRVLLGQVDRLARKVIDMAADAECAPVLTLPAPRHPAMRES